MCACIGIFFVMSYVFVVHFLHYDLLSEMPFVFVLKSFTHLIDPFHLIIYSMLFGNLYIYFDWNGKTEISGGLNLFKHCHDYNSTNLA